MASVGGPGKRGPSVLVTDSRERPQPPRAAQRPPGNPGTAARTRMPTRLISVDNVLQYASEVPSGQARSSPNRRPLPASFRRNTAIGTSPGTRVAQQNVPGRSTKVSEKLVLIPETVDEKEEDADDTSIGDEDRPLKDEEMDELKRRGGLRGRSYAERLPKASRAEKLARVTAYCTAEGYKTKATASFVKQMHGARTKLYDDCLYTVYHLPLLPGSEGYRIRSSPVLKTPGGRTILDEEIERSERRDYHEGYFEYTESYGVRGGDESPRHDEGEDQLPQEEIQRHREEAIALLEGRRGESPNRIAADATKFGEMFVFSYGVVVFWNFTEHQEKDILADMTFSQTITGLSLVSRPQDESDFETEEFHFEYNQEIDRPRIFNDMITLRSGDHMIKLTMSHTIAQSTKLNFFEERMSQTMQDAQYVPKRLALTGQLGMTRKETVKFLGRLFKSRVDVNLSSNILDVPNFFWDSEPTLHPLYIAIREYLEIGPRIKVLNERCRVFLDLAEILSDSIADTKMSRITWIIIALIILSIAVTVGEVVLRFSLLEREKGKTNVGIHDSDSCINFMNNITNIYQSLSGEEIAAFCGGNVIGETYLDL